MTRPLRVFIAYSKRDKKLLGELKDHLAAMERSGLLELWTDEALVPGREWDDEIHRQLAAADIILLLVSSAFIATDYCWKVELPTALARRRRGEAIVVPIVARACDWEKAVLPKPAASTDGPGASSTSGEPGPVDREATLGDIAALPPKGAPIDHRDQHVRDRAWMAVVAGLRSLVEAHQRPPAGAPVAAEAAAHLPSVAEVRALAIPGAPRHDLKEFLMILDRTRARKQLRELLQRGGAGARVLLHGDRDQGLDLFRKWLESSAAGLTEPPLQCYVIQYKVDGDKARTKASWSGRVTTALGFGGNPIDVALSRRAAHGPVLLVFDCTEVLLAEVEGVESLASMITDELRSALDGHQAPVHVVLLHTDAVVGWLARLLGRDQRARRLRESRYEIERALHVTYIPIEAPTFLEIEESLRRDFPHITDAALRECRARYDRVYDSVIRHRTFSRLAGALHDVLVRHT